MAIQTIGVRAVLLGLEAYQRGSATMVAANSAMAASIQGAGAGINNIGRGITNVGRTVGSFGTALTLGVTTPLVIAAGVATKSAIDFDDAFLGVAKTVDDVAKVSSDGMVTITKSGEELRGMLRDLALDVPISATELAGLTETIGQLTTGLDNEQLIELTEIIAELGVSTNLSGEQAAIGISRFISVMGESFDSARDIGNVIVELGNNFAVTESEIIQAANRLAGVGNFLDVPTQSILAAGAAIKLSGVETQAGASAIQFTMLEMNSAVLSGGEALTSFATVAGVSIDEFVETFEGDPVRAIQIFSEGLIGLQEAGIDVKDVLGDLDLDQRRSVRTLLSLGGAADKFTEALDAADAEIVEGNALAEEAAKRYSSWKSQLQIFKNVLTDVLITIGDELLPILFKFLNETVVPLVNKFKELSPEIKTNILRFLALAAVIGPVLIILGGFLQIVGTMVSIFGTLTTVGGGVVGIFSGIAGAILGIGSIIGPVVLGLAALVAAVLAIAAIANLDTIKEQFVNIAIAAGESATEILDSFSNLKDIVIEFAVDFGEDTFEGLKENIGPIFEDIGTFITEFFEDLGPFIGGLVDDVGEFIEEHGDTLITAFNNVVIAIGFVWEKLGPILISTLNNIWTFIQAIIGAALRIILGIILIVTSIIAGDWEALWEGILMVFTGVWDAIKAVIVFLLPFLKGLFESSLTEIGDFLETKWEEIKETAINVWEAIKIFMSETWETIKTFATEKWEEIKEGLSIIWESIKLLAGALWQNMIDNASEKIEEMKTTVSDKFEEMKTTVIDIANGLVDGVKETIEELVTFFLDAGSRMINAFISGLNKRKEALFKLARSIANTIKNIISGAFSGSPVWFTFHIGEGLMDDLAAGVTKQADSAMSNISATVRDGISSIMGSQESGALTPINPIVQIVPVPIEKTVMNVDATFNRSEETQGSLARSLQGLINTTG